MELAAAAGSAATVVQLVDFAGGLLKSTTTFLSAVSEASKELNALHDKISQLSSLFEQTRRIANSYQNSNLAATPNNQHSFDLLSIALTSCAQDLQTIKNTAQKPLQRSTSAVVKWKRRVKYVIDEERLKRPALRMDGHITQLTAIISCISISNDAETHKSMKRVHKLVENVPELPTQISNLAFENQHKFLNLESRVIAISNALEQIISPRLVVNDQHDRTRIALPFAASEETARSVITPITTNRNISNAFVDPASILLALQRFTPLIMRLSQKFKRSHGFAGAIKPVGWALSELHFLIANVHEESAKAYSQVPSPGSCDGRMMKRFQRQTILTNDPRAIDKASEELERAFSLLLDTWKEESERKSPNDPIWIFYLHHKREEEDLTRVDNLSKLHVFCNPVQGGVLGVSADITLRTKGGWLISESRLSFFDVHDRNSQIVEAIRAGDHGVSNVRKILKAGDAYAGDSDYYGRSLISHAARSKSRDMCSLLLQMGADARDIRGEKGMTFPVIKQWLAEIDENTWTPKSELVDTPSTLTVPSPYIDGMTPSATIHTGRIPLGPFMEPNSQSSGVKFWRFPSFEAIDSYQLRRIMY